MKKTPTVAAAVAIAFSLNGGRSARAAEPAPELSGIPFSEIRLAGPSVPTPASTADPADAGKRPADDCQFLRDRLADPRVSEVIVPPGTYVCAAPVIMNRSGVTLRGDGRPLLRLADRAESPLLVMGGLDDDSRGVPTPVTGLLVEGIRFDGNRAHQSGECWGGPCDSGGKTGVRNSGIDLRGVWDSTVRDVEVTGARSGGLVTERECVRVRVEGLKARDSYYDGLSVNRTKDSVFENLELTDNQYAGLTMDVDVEGNVFRDGVVSANHDVGVFLRRASRNRFERLTVAANRSHGVYLSDADREPGTCATGNVFSRVAARGNGRDGFHMDGDCSGDRLEDSPAVGNGGVPVSGPWALSSN